MVFFVGFGSERTFLVVELGDEVEATNSELVDFCRENTLALIGDTEFLTGTFVDLFRESIRCGFNGFLKLVFSVTFLILCLKYSG